MGDDKAYEGTMILGTTTDTGDCDGQITDTKPVPALTDARLLEVMAKFKGDIQQIPPMVSAIKHEGRPLYKLARKGIEVVREPRLIHIFDLRLLKFESPRIEFRLACSKGTYVRTLAADMGAQLGCGAHLAELRRTASGKFSIEQAHTLEQVLAQPKDALAQWILPMLDVARGLRG
jgi:tRNA pseudouridine55 synthase